METTETKTNEVLEVKVILSEEVLTENPELLNHYDTKKEILAYKMSKNLTKDLKEELKSILESSQSKELVALNPAIEALMDMQGFKDLKYDAENSKTTIEEFKHAKKTIGSFNSSITKVKSFLKKPHIDYNKKVDTIFKFLKEESDNTKNALEVNFDEYIQEQELIKKEKEDKKKAAELAEIEKLAAANKEQEEKLANQRRQTRKLEIEAEINRIIFDVNTKVATLNLEGLESLKESVKRNSFESLVSKDDGFSEEDYGNFKGMHTLNKESAIRVIEISIKGINDAKAKDNLENEKAVLEAKVPSSLVDGENDVPFGLPEEDPLSEELSDIDKFKGILTLLEDFDANVIEMIYKAKSIQFKDESLIKIQGILTDKSLPQVKEWSSKLVDWTSKKVSVYEDFVNKNK